MKIKFTLFFFIVLLICSNAIFSQSPPEAINYQMVIRSNTNVLIANQNITCNGSTLEEIAMLVNKLF